MSVKEAVQQLSHDPRIAAAVSAATTGTGAGTVLDYIPSDIGKLATLVGIILSVILIRVHLVGLKKVQFELKVMEEKERERRAAAAQREQSGEPLRRDGDLV